MIKLRESELLKCCGSPRWSAEMAAHSFPNPKEVLATADSIWWGLSENDWREAFRGLGSDPARGNGHLFRQASPSVGAALQSAMAQYQQRFGFSFPIGSNGRTAEQILRALQTRLDNDGTTELRAAAEQHLETVHLRLKHLMTR